MAKFLFNEQILREDFRRGTYFIPYIIGILIATALAIIPWVLASRVAIINTLLQYITNYAVFLQKFQAYFPAITGAKILVSIVFGVIALILLIVGLRNLLIPRLIVTENRVCLMKRPHKYYEARFDKITAFVIKGHKLKVYADGKKVFAFGPISEVYAARDTISRAMEKRNAEKAGSTDSNGYDPIAVSDPEYISKDGDMFA